MVKMLKLLKLQFAAYVHKTDSKIFLNKIIFHNICYIHEARRFKLSRRKFPCSKFAVLLSPPNTWQDHF